MALPLVFSVAQQGITNWYGFGVKTQLEAWYWPLETHDGHFYRAFGWLIPPIPYRKWHVIAAGVAAFGIYSTFVAPYAENCKKKLRLKALSPREYEQVKIFNLTIKKERKKNEQTGFMSARGNGDALSALVQRGAILSTNLLSQVIGFGIDTLSLVVLYPAASVLSRLILKHNDYHEDAESVIDVARHMFSQEGIAAFYQGIVPLVASRLLKSIFTYIGYSVAKPFIAVGSDAWTDAKSELPRDKNPLNTVAGEMSLTASTFIKGLNNSKALNGSLWKYQLSFLGMLVCASGYTFSSAILSGLSVLERVCGDTLIHIDGREHITTTAILRQLSNLTWRDSVQFVAAYLWGYVGPAPNI